MRKYLHVMQFLVLIITFTFSQAQVKRSVETVAKKKGTYTSSQSSGNAQGANCWNSFSSSTNFLCIDSTINLMVQYTYLGNNNLDNVIVTIRYDAADTVYDTVRNDQYTGALDGIDTAVINISVNRAGTYHFNMVVPNTFDTTDAVSGDIVVVNGTASCPADLTIGSVVPINIPSQTIFCNNSPVTLTAPGSNDSLYQWYNDSGPILSQTAATFSTSSPGNYYVQTTDKTNCILNSSVVNITDYTPPATPLNIVGDTCKAGTLLLPDSTGDLNPQSITWYYNNDSVIKTFDNTGIVVAGGNGAGNALNQLNQPYGIFLDSVNDVYVSDYANKRIMKWAAGSLVGQLVEDSNSLFTANPTDVLLNGSTLVVSTTQGVVQFSPSATVPFTRNAWGLSTDLAHNIYFANDAPDFSTAGAGAIYKQDSTILLAGNNTLGPNLSSINYPNGIYVDTLNNLYVADDLTDTANNFYGRVTKWPSGNTAGTLVAGGNGAGNAPNQIWFVAGIAFDKKGNLYVSDALNNRVQMWRPGANHGITIASGFTPWGIRVDDSANVYVADQTNNRVVKFPSMLQNKITADTAGVYKAVVTYAGGCSNTSADFVIQNCNLPLTLLNFRGQLKNTDALLTWQTASESNTSYFNVQRSFDGVSFTNIGKVSAAGNSNLLLNYSYNDNNVTALNVRNIYYRLIEVDMDGKTFNSNIVNISLSAGAWNFTVSPNPVSASLLRVQLNYLFGQANISVFDITGRKLSVRQISGSGNNVFYIDAGKLTAGMYMIQVLQNGQSQYLKFEKQ